MTSKTLTDLPLDAVLTGDETILGLQNGKPVRMTVSQLKQAYSGLETASGTSAGAAAQSALNASSHISPSSENAASAAQHSETAVSYVAPAATSASNADSSATQAATFAANADASRLTVQQSSDAARSSANNIANVVTGSLGVAASNCLTANAQAVQAMFSALASASLAQQDLTGATSSVLHRSPNAVVSMYIYDTSKDSDGGAWRDKCAQLSWMNEPLNGNWLFATSQEGFQSELDARSFGATLGSEINKDPSFSSSAGWVLDATASISGGKLIVNNTGSGNPIATRTDPIGGALTAKPYQITLVIDSIINGNIRVCLGDATIVFVAVGAGTHTFTVIPPAGSTLQLKSQGGPVGVISKFSIKPIVAINTNAGDYYQGPDGKFYKLNGTYAPGGTLPGVTEIFRGNTYKFPRLAAIVAEAGSLTIYALDQPGRPMWRSWPRPSLSSFPYWWKNGSPTSVVAINGCIYFSTLNAGDVQEGLLTIDLIHDRYGKYGGNANASGFLPYPISSYSKVSVPALNVGGLPGIVGNGIANAVSVMVRPNAPLDAATGLPIPTIGVAVGIGNAGQIGSIIMDDGSVVNVSIPGNDGTSVAFTSRGDVVWGQSATSALLIGPMPAYGGPWITTNNRSYGQLSIPSGSIGQNNKKRAIAVGPSLAVITTGASVSNILVQVRENPSTPAAGLANHITGTYNTGWMPGDIRRAMFIDTVTGTVSGGTNLIINGDFTADTTGWTPTSASLSVVNGELVVTSTAASFARAAQTIQVKNGVFYQVSGKATQNTSTVRARVFANNILVASVTGAANTFSQVVQATGTTMDIFLDADTATSGTSSSFDNIVVTELVSDHSAKAKHAVINGTLVRTAVATASQMVMCGGFSATNYAQEAYSSDHDPALAAFGGSAWFNVPTTGFGPNNLALTTEDLTTVNWTGGGPGGITKSVAATAFPTGITGGTLMTEDTSVNATHHQFGAIANLVAGRVYNVSAYVKQGSGARTVNISPNFAPSSGLYVNPVTGAVLNVSAGSTNVQVQADINGWWRVSFDCVSNVTGTNYLYHGLGDATGNVIYTGDGASSVYMTGVQVSAGSGVLPYVKTVNSQFIGISPIYDRSAPTGSYYRWGIDGNGMLAAELFDGTTTRRVTGSTQVNIGVPVKGEFSYVPNGVSTSLAVKVNGIQQATVTGAALLTMTNANAVLTYGNTRTLDAAFPGKIAMVKPSMTVPTADQSKFMYEQEKLMFRDGAQVTLFDSSNLLNIAYDVDEQSLHTVSSASKCKFVGLVRVNSELPVSSSFGAVAHARGIKLLARASIGVDISYSSKSITEELFNRVDSASNGKLVIGFDYDSIAAQTDFVLPDGWTATKVISAGVVKREGASKDWIRVYDGFAETIRFNVSQGVAWVRILAVRS